MRSLHALVESYRPLASKLRSIYGRIPDVSCRGKADCCTLMPDLTLVEAISGIESLGRMDEGARHGVLVRIGLYFYLNPVRIMTCPFLQDKRCIIYEDRFCGCRTYGLWSRKYYEKMAAQSLEAKAHLKAVWQQAGVELPEDVTSFRVPYCTNVKIKKGQKPDDSALLKVGRRAARLSQELSSSMHQRFVSEFFMDFSFFLVSLASGVQGAVNDKFVAVKEVCSGSGDGFAVNRARQAADRLQGFFSSF